MKKTFTLFFFLISFYCFTQSISQSALNIDLNKNIGYYNLTMDDLKSRADEFYIDLNELIPKNNHFLSKFKFDSQEVFFNNDGSLNYILLIKRFLTKMDLENSLIEIDYEISKRYGLSDEKNEKVIAWRKEFISISIFIDKNVIYAIVEKTKFNNEEIKEDIDTIVTESEFYIPLAENGDSEAQFNLYLLYNLGKGGVSKDLSQAFYWCEKSAKQGHSKAQFYLGGIYLNGFGTLIDKNKAFYWMTKSAKEGNRSAQYLLAGMYWKGEGTLKDTNQTFYWYKKSAEQGEPNAQYQLGICFYYGQGTLENKRQSSYWIKKAYENDEKSALNPQLKAQQFWSDKELWKYE